MTALQNPLNQENQRNQDPIIVYSRPNCPLDPSINNILKSVNARYEYVDIRQNEDARQRVREINNGNESVPTLVFPDGSTLTEPLPHQLRKQLRQMGYEISTFKIWMTYFLTNPIYLIALLVIGFAILRGVGVF